MRIDDVTDLDWYLDNVVVPAGIERRRVGPVLSWQGSWNGLATKLRASAGDPPVGGVLRLALEQGFVVSRAQVRSCGVPDATTRRLVRRGEWTACGHGAITVVTPAGLSPPAESFDLQRRRHALLAAAAALRRPGHVIGTASAAILHGLPTLEVPSLPELLAPSPATFGRRAAAHVRVGDLMPAEVDSWFGAALTSPARTVVDLARFNVRSGLMAADAALHEGVVGLSEIEWAISRSGGLPGIRRAREVLGLASPLIESPLESLTHLALDDSQSRPPQLQAEIRGGDGKRYRVDFYWPDLRLVLEADGRTKYTNDELWREKRRELALIRAGYRVARVTWPDVVADWPATWAWLADLMSANPPS